MLFVIGTFVGVLVLVVGIYWLTIERPEAHEQGKLRKRLRAAVGPKTAKRIDFLKEAEKLSAVKSLDAALARTDRIAGSLQKLLARADVKLTVGGLLLASACLFAGGMVRDRLDHAAPVAGARRRLPAGVRAVPGRPLQGDEANPQVRGTVPGHNRSDRARTARWPRLHDRARARGRRGPAAGGGRVPAPLRPAEFRHADGRGAEGVRGTHPTARRPLSS